MIRTAKGALVEYGLSIPPLALVFDFNPQTLTRTRSVTVKTGSSRATRGGYDFLLPTETARASQGVTVQPETFSLEILVDATDRMAREGGQDPIADAFRGMGVQPELDTLRTMVEPKSQGPGGMQLLSSLGASKPRAFQRDEHASVLLFVWSDQVLPVFLTSVQVETKDFLPSLVPYRATVTLSMQVIEGKNPFYLREKARQLLGAALNLGRLGATALQGVI